MKTGETYDLATKDVIDVDLEGEASNSRFLLRFESTVTAAEDELDHLVLEISAGGNKITIRQDQIEEAEVGLYNLAGQELYRNSTLRFSNGQAELDNLGLQPGLIYILKVQDFDPIKFVLR